MPSLNDYAVFVQIMDAGSISVAAKRNGHSVQNVSRALARIEAELGVSLARRTTRSFVATQAGIKLLARLRLAIAELDRAREELHEEKAVLAGEIKVSSSTLFGPHYMVPAIAAFMVDHPAIKFKLKISDSFTDPIFGNVDVAVRIGALIESSLIAKLLGYSRRVVVASPLYLAKNGEPNLPSDLARHCCIVRVNTGEADRWRFRVGGSEQTVRVKGDFVTDSAAACNEATLAGLGIGSAQLWQVRDSISQGKLRLLLPGFEPPPLPVHILWTPTKQLTARTRHFIDFLARYLSPIIA